MNVIMEPSFIFGIVVTIIALGISFAAFKPNKTEVSAIKNWLSRDKWSGQTIQVPLESWRQTETKYGNDYIYDFYFNANINGYVKKYIAKGIVRPDDIHKLKKGMLLSVKYSNNTPLKIAVTSVNY
ncbi:TPA: hypothetical protein QIB15_000283 [Klebsiella aerogenes]|uniref:hypothetical protein n=2 Tax=Klebsiella aerogenes TaxID=548 RepID=UPI00063CD148|nr:hypothetical protein [Klebsiella aerogenes]KLE44588.1 hypothetical protein YA11_18525 [Klebsiella aerogenes]MCT4772943.1 hypothetical protein [Klebsiella aerogenes]MEB7617929.1 hypothetical protein [Klebsiella aerogenes]HBT3292625.1 hypothetical protein [Klebsiella aerogenes]HDT0385317.1 hypothetical protein [Klebsiella aerogenes]